MVSTELQEVLIVSFWWDAASCCFRELSSAPSALHQSLREMTSVLGPGPCIPLGGTHILLPHVNHFPGQLAVGLSTPFRGTAPLPSAGSSGSVWGLGPFSRDLDSLLFCTTKVGCEGPGIPEIQQLRESLALRVVCVILVCCDGYVCV